MPNASAVVLAGGQSRRLGVNKAFVTVGGVVLIERVLRQLGQVSDDIVIVTGDPAAYEGLGARVVLDGWPGAGSLGGIHTGLQAARHDRAVVVGCDMPFLNVRLLRSLILLSADYDVVVPRVDSFLEPLHAVYGKACLQPIEDLLRAGERRIVAFLDRVRVRYVDAAEIQALDPSQLSFLNINTPQDLEQAEELAQRQLRGEG